MSALLYALGRQLAVLVGRFFPSDTQFSPTAGTLPLSGSEIGTITVEVNKTLPT